MGVEKVDQFVSDTCPPIVFNYEHKQLHFNKDMTMCLVLIYKFKKFASHTITGKEGLTTTDYRLHSLCMCHRACLPWTSIWATFDQFEF